VVHLEGAKLMPKIVIAVVVLAHGIGHSMGILKVFNVAAVNRQWRGDSWLLTSVAGPTVTNGVGVMLWSLAIVGFAAVAAIVVGWLPEAWFAPLAIASSFVSLAGLLFFPVAFPTFSTIGALAVDVVVLVAVLWYHWVPSDLAA
jgi:hypothetical protein